MIVYSLLSVVTYLIACSTILPTTSYSINYGDRYKSMPFSNIHVVTRAATRTISPNIRTSYTTRCNLSSQIDDEKGPMKDTNSEIPIGEKEDETSNFESSTTTRKTATTTTASATATTSPSESDFLLGQWEEQNGNYILRPPKAEQPRALIHFLGGALVGAAPDVTYRYLLEKLSQNGYLIVATPYNLSFDYLKACDGILQKFETIAPSLARQYGPIPVIGVGHSCGALLQVIITCLFTDTPRAGNILMSYNNKEVKDAVPLFEEVVIPFFQSVKGNTNSTDGSDDASSPDGILALKMLLQGLQISLEEGKLPNDDFLMKLSTSLLPSNTPSFLSSLTTPPAFIRSSITSLLLTPASTSLKSSGLLPIFHQSINILQQIPLLIDEVATQDIRSFNPNKESISKAIKRAYRARRTLLIKYKDDTIFDETDDVDELLKDAEKVMRLKRPMIEFDLQKKVLDGQHATPLLAPPLDLDSIEKMENLVGDDLAKEKLFYKEADETVRVLVDWMEENL